MTAGTYTWQQASPVWFLVCRSLSCSEVRFSTRTQPSCKEQTLDIRKTGWTVRPCRNPQLRFDFWSWKNYLVVSSGKGEYVYPIICGRNPHSLPGLRSTILPMARFFFSLLFRVFPPGGRMFGAFVPVVGATRHRLNSWFAELGRTLEVPIV